MIDDGGTAPAKAAILRVNAPKDMSRNSAD